MPGRLVTADKELNEFFELVELDAGTDLSKLNHLVVTCKKCPRGQGEKPPRKWELELNEDGSIGRSERNALIAHALAHDKKPKLRRLG